MGYLYLFYGANVGDGGFRGTCGRGRNVLHRAAWLSLLLGDAVAEMRCRDVCRLRKTIVDSVAIRCAGLLPGLWMTSCLRNHSRRILIDKLQHVQNYKNREDECEFVLTIFGAI